MNRVKDDFILLLGVPDNDKEIFDYIADKESLCITKLSYVLPYENFYELKAFQLRTNARAFKPRYTYVAIDLSEWLEHEEDEYFEISLKFFHDCSDFNYIFFIRENYSTKEIESMYRKVSKYMKGSIEHLNPKTQSRSNEHERN